MEGMFGYLKVRMVVVDAIKIAMLYLVIKIIMHPELLANWIKVVRSAFAG